MSAAALLAFGAGGLAVLAAWEALAAVPPGSLPARVRTWVGPLLAAGRDGRAPGPAEARRLAATAALAVLAGGWVLAGPVAGVALACGAPLGLRLLVTARRRRRAAALDRASPAIARALADALAAGRSLRGAVAAAAAAGLPEPAGEELRRAAAALGLGAPTDEVLHALAARSAGRALRVVVAAALVQRRAGGDLAALLRELAGTFEAAARVREDARGATAQARYTGGLVAAIPAGALALAELTRPGFLGSLVSEPLAAALAVAALVLQVLALLVIRRLARVRA